MIRFGFFAISLTLALTSPAQADLVELCRETEDRALQIDRCTTALQSGHLSDADLISAHFNRGSAYAELDNPDRAIEDFDQAINLDPENAEAHEGRGFAYLDLDLPEQALGDFDEAIRLDPGFAHAHGGRGVAHERLGQMDEAMAAYDQAIRLDPERALFYRARGSLQFDLREYRYAINDFDRAIEIEPELAWTYAALGQTLQRLGRPAEAIESFDHAIALDPEQSWYYAERGNAYADLDQQERAIEDYDVAIGLDPYQAWFHIIRAIAYLDLDQPIRAMEGYERATQLRRNSLSAYADIADSHRRRGHLTLAVESYNQAILQSPGAFQLYRSRGLARLELGQRDQAVSDFGEYLRLHDNLFLFRDRDQYWLIRNLHYAGYHDTALILADNGLRAEPDRYDLLEVRANIHAALGRNAEAMADFVHAMEVGGALRVGQVQETLAELGYYTELITNTYGPATERALKACLLAECRFLY